MMSSTTGETKVVSLYQSQKKIYAKSVTGRFANLRWLMVFVTQAIFYGLAWLPWNGRQAVLFDLGARKFYIFDWIFWPQDVLYLTFILIVSAYSLFFVTAIAGRIFCGYACPQTVYTEIFMWVEKKFEGDRAARMKLDQAPMSFEKAWRKGGKHLAWVLIGLWTGFTFVGYFTPIKTLAHEVLTATTGPWETFWILFYGFATWGNAGFMREQVCKYMCPYARFQSVMFDRDTMIVTYDKERGEPRGGRKRSADTRALNLGSCVDCSLCVQVCPTGIDIRDGQQMECIGCGLCIDACNETMDKVGRPRGLIRYASLNSIERGTKFRFTPRMALYLAVLGALGALLAVLVFTRTDVESILLRAPGSLFQQLPDGRIENLYTLKVVNKTAREIPIELKLENAPGEIRVMGAGPLVAPKENLAQTSVLIILDRRTVPESSRKLVIGVYSKGKRLETVKTVFVGPRKPIAP